MPSIHDLTGPAGPLEALLDEPSASPGGEGIRAAVVFAHPHPQYGGTMHTKAVFQGTKGLTRVGCPVLRFNFRGVGASAGVFDNGDGEIEDYRAALGYMAAKYPGARLWAAGFSFGAWVALETGADDERVSALIGIAPPVMTSVSGMDYRFPKTLASTKAKFFVQGEEDEVCPLEGLRAFYAKLEEPKELVVIEGADHLFEGKTMEVGEALEELLGDY
ncbi:Dot/Icm type IV secretion system effector CoxH3 [soil metagenome]|nr:alpha/beta hydrolase [Acidobacteriota bacterium]